MSRNSIAATRAQNGSNTSQSNASSDVADNPAQNNPVDGNSLSDSIVFGNQWKFSGAHNIMSGQRLTSPGQSNDEGQDQIYENKKSAKLLLCI